MSKFRFAIVGCGVIHGTHIDAIKKMPDEAELVAVCDEVPERAETTAQKHGVAAFTDLETMLKEADFDVLNVCTPSGLHAAAGILGANAGKHIVCEKPIDVSLKAADALIDACRTNRTKLVVISQIRYSSGMQYLKAQLDAGRLGALCYGESTTKWYRTQQYYDSGGWRGTWALDGGGALMNQGVHLVDQLVWTMGKPKSVAATMATRAHERIEVEDVVSATIEFENGAVGTLIASTAMYPGYKQSIEVYGTGGTIIVENNRVRHAQFQGGTEERGMFNVKAAPPEVENFVYQGAVSAESGEQTHGAADPTAISLNGHVEHLRDLMGAIREDRDTFMNGQEARNALEVILAVYESARTGKRIDLPLAA
ncbi:MAG: Gfo/Idh/MocA family oxidoreductase [Capsulimonadales bacterium]|nr:Gfo/Idh/MocA family oxidoreductase [Capsulimonadales bacterium]